MACGVTLHDQVELIITVTGGWSHFEVSCESCPTKVIDFEPSVYTLTGLRHSTAYDFSVKTVTKYYQLGAEHDKTSEPGTVTCQTLERGNIFCCNDRLTFLKLSLTVSRNVSIS